jgi:hypothetical protein
MGAWYSVIAPVVVIRPTPALGNSVHVNHSAPSGPDVIPLGPLLGVGTANSVITPAVVMRPIWPDASVNHSASSGPFVIEVGEL